MENTSLVKMDNRFAVIPHWVIEAKISPTAFYLYAILVKYANNATGEAWPSRATLARDLGKGDKTVDRALKELVDAGAVKVTRRVRPGSKEFLPNLYEVITKKPHGSKATQEPEEIGD